MASEIHIPFRNNPDSTNPESGHGHIAGSDAARIKLVSDTLPNLSAGLGWAERLAKPGVGSFTGEVNHMLHGFVVHQPPDEGNAYKPAPNNSYNQPPSQFKS